MIQDRQLAVQKTFYVDQLLTSQGGNMTATEVLQRNEEKMRLLGPVLGRLQSELLQPLIERVYKILERQGVFKPAPEILAQQDVEIEYVSPLAKAQKSGDLNTVMRGVEIFGAMSQFAPVLDYLDTDGLAKYVQKVWSCCSDGEGCTIRRKLWRMSNKIPTKKNNKKRLIS